MFLSSFYDFEDILQIQVVQYFLQQKLGFNLNFW